MKKLFTLLALSSVASTSFGQITINSTDMPVPAFPYNIIDISTTTAANPAVGTGATWNYSSYLGSSFTSNYITETDTFFTHAGIDVYAAATKSLTSGLGYSLFSEIDFNALSIKEAGVKVLYQAYGLPSATTDSLFIPAQRYILPASKRIFSFPCTANSVWSSATRRSVNLEITVASASLSHASVQHVYTINRKDTIVGWGKLRVYTASGPSIEYDVLMDRMWQFAIDSFYMGGAPANPALLIAFGLSQGQRTDSVYTYDFFRKTTFCYLLRFHFGRDATYTTPVGKYVHRDGVIADHTGVSEVNGLNYSTVVFPNPSVGAEINMLVSGREVAGGKYTVTDIAGRTIQYGNVEMKGGAVCTRFNDALANGNYFFTVVDANGGKVAAEQFTVSK